MFHIREIEVVHWDYWQRFTLPLDAQIVTIVGPNGSGKTTLLDALRTLFALKCSGKRDFRRYVRRGERGYAWLRAVVANRAAPGGRRPFFPCLHDQVTLACRIRRAGGDWTRDYAIVDGDVAIEGLESGSDWIGLRDYQNRLAWSGLTPAIAKVLSLEQGETDKLCEYSPKALLDLVFDVFGDKEVLDNYQAAREEQRNADKELEVLGLDLDRLRLQAETRRTEAQNFEEWQRLHDESLALEADILPRLECVDLLDAIAADDRDIVRLETARGEHDADFVAAQERLNATRGDRERHLGALKAAKADEDAGKAAHLAAHDRVRELEKRLEERSRLRARVEREDGADALALEACHAAAERESAQLRGEEVRLTASFEEKAEQLRQAKSRAGPPGDPEVRRFRQLLDDAGIAHQSLAEIVEITDSAWQASVEAVLRPYRHVLLLAREADRHGAWALGERERFRHFLVAERSDAPTPVRGSLAEVVEFAAPTPRWLSDLLNRIQRVDDADAARHLPRDAEWITRDGYHRERRGARHLGRPNEFHFGELARQARNEQLEADIRRLDAELAALRPRRDAVNETLAGLRNRLLGLQSASLLAARSGEFAEADDQLPEAKRLLAVAEAALAVAVAGREDAREQIAGCDIGIANRQREIAEIERRRAEVRLALDPKQAQQGRRREDLEHRRHGMPDNWLTAEAMAPLRQRYETAHLARGDLRRLQDRLAADGWITDPSVIARRDRVIAELAAREADFASRQAYCNSARRLTDDARGAYIAKLKATVRQYGRNLKALGDLANVDVECPAPALENDDLALARAGLEVRFDFDRKGAVGLNDGEASGGQQVMKSLILLIGLLMDDARPGGFVFIDEPFAHLDVANIDRVGAFLRATRAQYLITTPVTHNANVFAPAQLTLVTRKKHPGEDWAQAIGVLKRAV